MYPTIGEQYIIDDTGHTTAVILPIDSYRKIIQMLRDFDAQLESRTLSDLPEFKELVDMGMNDICMKRTRPWKDVWNEL